VTATAAEELPLAREQDVVSVRRAVREAMSEMGFSIVDRTKMVTAASELARNIMDYGGGGLVRMERLTEGVRVGLRLAFVDEGPGIADVDLALTDGYSSGDGLGLGLSGSRRLVNEFDIVSGPDCGTTVTITRWR
jgi:serine/threonine-protein kinase RsbT